MIARIWKGWTDSADADEYVDYLETTGVSELRATEGNEGVFVFRRVEGERAEFIVVSLWREEEDVRAFSGDDLEEARFYPEDDRMLVDREWRAPHYEVVSRALP